MTLGPEEIKSRFGFHKGTTEEPGATIPKHAQLRKDFVKFAEMLDGVLKDSRAKSLAFTALQEASMWAHFCIAEDAPLVEE